MERFIIEGKTIELFPAEKAGVPLVIVNGEDGEGEALRSATKALADADFSLAAIGGLDWDAELTPWPAPGLRKGQAFSGEAGQWLDTLTGRVLPEIETRLPGAPCWTGLAGYSLAGLFAVFALYHTDAFARVASCSGSLWYSNFAEYAASSALRCTPERAYFSVGDREARTKNPAMRGVEDATRRMAERLEALGIETRFELNPGGHFADPLGRLAKGVAWLLG